MDEIKKLRISQLNYGIICVISSILCFVTGFISINMFSNEDYLGSVAYRWYSNMAMMFTILFCIIIGYHRIRVCILKNNTRLK